MPTTYPHTPYIRHHYIRCLLLLASILCIVDGIFAQTQQYIYPMKIPVSLSANFGELRPNHFHSGLDFRTQKREGIPVYAVADGYVSRIGVLSWGYGNALYITHRNGSTSVYAHLSEFAPNISMWVKKRQYQLQSFVIDEQVDAQSFPFKQGELIGYSGNSGHSMGPHLHFELRDANQNPFNPLSRDIYSVPDHIAPQASNLFVYHLNYVENTFIRMPAKTYPLKRVNGGYMLAASDTIVVGDDVVFGLDMLDRKDGTQSTFGIYLAQLLYDDQLALEWNIDHFGFTQTRYVNAIIDFESYARTKRYVTLFYKMPANMLQIYTHTADGGILRLPYGHKEKVEMRIMDDAGNISRVVFWAKNAVDLTSTELLLPEYSRIIHAHKSNAIIYENFKIIVPHGAIYESCLLKMEYDSQRSTALSPLYSVTCMPSAPLHLNAIVGIRANIPDYLHDKVVMAGRNMRGKKAVRDGSFWLATTRDWTAFQLAIDTTAPYIKYLSPRSDKVRKAHLVRFRITDNMTGIKRYNGYVDGEWALFEWDARTNIAVYKIDYARVRRNVWHKVRITAQDEVGNSADETHRIFF